MSIASGSQTVGRPMEILFVEDSLTAARLTIGALQKGKIQHRMTWLKTGEEALEFLRHQAKFSHAPRPDLILLDLGLPGISGRDVLAAAKVNESLKGIPVVVMTASTAAEDRADVEQFDVAAYLTKPVDLEKFLWLVKELKHCWLEEVILPTVAEVDTPTPAGALSPTGSLGLFGRERSIGTDPSSTNV